MRTFKFFVLIGAFTMLAACSGGGGGGGGFVPTGRIVAIAPASDSTRVVVGGPSGSATPGALATVTMMPAGAAAAARAGEETVDTVVGDDGGFQVAFDTDTSSTFRVEIVSDAVDATIGVTLLTGAVERDLALLGSVPTDIEILDGRAYVVNAFSDNVQVFDINQSPPAPVGTIVLPLGQGPGPITFIDSTRAVVPNNIGQGISILDLDTLTCETIIANEDGDFGPCGSTVIIPDAFEEPSGVEVINGRLFVTNNNLNPFFSPAGDGFITVIDLGSLELSGFIEASGANSGSPRLIKNRLWVLNSGNILFDLDTFEFTCDTDFPPSIDIINPTTLMVQDTIPIPLNAMRPELCLPGTLSPTTDGRAAYMGLGITGAILKVDTAARIVTRGTTNPITVTGTGVQNLVSDIKFRTDGIGFFTLFNTDQVAVIDSTTDTLNPFPFIAPFPAGLRADDPGSDFFDGPQALALPEDGGFPDIYFITGISSRLGSIDTSEVILP